MEDYNKLLRTENIKLTKEQERRLADAVEYANKILYGRFSVRNIIGKKFYTVTMAYGDNLNDGAYFDDNGIIRDCEISDYDSDDYVSYDIARRMYEAIARDLDEKTSVCFSEHIILGVNYNYVMDIPSEDFTNIDTKCTILERVNAKDFKVVD